MEPAVIDLRKEHNTAVQKFPVIKNLGLHIIRQAVNRMSRIVGIQRVRVVP